jgi:hypothetical protein
MHKKEPWEKAVAAGNSRERLSRQRRCRNRASRTNQSAQGVTDEKFMRQIGLGEYTLDRSALRQQVGAQHPW